MISDAMNGTVARLMTRDPFTIAADAPLADAVEVMDGFDVSGLPVIDGEGRLAGVLSRTDLVAAVATRSLWSGWPGLSVRHLMTSPAVTIRSDAPLVDAARLMEREHIHRLVVVDDSEGTPIGVLSLTDFVRLLSEDSDA